MLACVRVLDRPQALSARRIAARAARTLATPLVPADYLDLISPLRTGADLRGRVLARRNETADAATITIRPGRDWRGHRAGQYVRLGVDVGGVRHWRPYSLTSPATASTDTISITVKAVADGVVSRHLVRALRPGTLVALDQATGDFTLPPQLPCKLLFVTAGSGITPVMGMLRSHELDDAVLVHSAPAPSDVIFGEQLRSLHGAQQIRLIERHTTAQGTLTPDELGTLVPDWHEREAYVCGPLALIDDYEHHWQRHGLAGRFHCERFRPALTAAGEGGTIVFSGSGLAAEGDGGTPILNVGEQAGVQMPSGCRMGICFGCVSELRRGSVRDLRDGTVTTAEDGSRVAIQTCIHAAAGDCEIAR